LAHRVGIALRRVADQFNVELLLGAIERANLPSSETIASALSKELRIQIDPTALRNARSFTDIVDVLFPLLPRLTPIAPPPAPAAEENGRLPPLPTPARRRDPPNVQAIDTDTTIAGYRVIRPLGRGGFSSVYLAYHQESDTKVALKFASQDGGGAATTRLTEVRSQPSKNGISPDEIPAEAMRWGPQGSPAIGRLSEEQNELLLLAQRERCAAINHANVAKLLGTVDIQGKSGLIFEYARGQTLRQLRRGSQPLHVDSLRDVARICRDIGGHGDIKPENIIVKPTGKVVLIDPAVSLQIDGREVATMTPRYNPFLLRGVHADVHALAIMVYEFLTDRLPFEVVPWEYAGRSDVGEEVSLSRSYFLSYPTPYQLNPKTPTALGQIVYNAFTQPDYDLTRFIHDADEFIGQP